MALSASFPQGTRVECTDKLGNRHLAMVTGHQETRTHGAIYLELIREGCASGVPQFWPARSVIALPQPEQLVALGGDFVPPKGYPYITRTRK